MPLWNNLLFIDISISPINCNPHAVSAVCKEGDIQLVNGSLLNEGRVVFCYNSAWRTVCSDKSWSHNEARAVCKQLGYRTTGILYQMHAGMLLLFFVLYTYTIGAQFFREPYFGVDSGPIVVLDGVECNSNAAALLDCVYNLTELHYPSQTCTGIVQSAGVSCLNPLKNISLSIELINTSHSPLYYVKISWQLRSMVISQPNLFHLRCSNDEVSHRIEVWVDNKTFTTQLGRLIPSPTNYTCCVRAVSGPQLSSTLIDEICTQVTVTVASSNPTEPLDRTSIVGGILGLIIAILLILLAFCGGALLFLLQSRVSILKR